ncbi:MAG TPA: hypothetical protein VK670_15220 [Silvibacterium sp.]|nr:hypothetical protein [Silvibacterium sp.]
MPQIQVIVWNIQNLGEASNFRGNWQYFGRFVANVARNRAADVILIEELKLSANPTFTLQHIQFQLNALPAPFNNWYYEWIKGAINHTGNPPYNTSADLMFDEGHDEGYAVFWNQNISKFTINRAPPIQPPGAAPVANQQSETVRMQLGLAAGTAVPAGGILTPAFATPYVLPIGTTLPGGAPLGFAQPVASGFLLPAGTLIGPGGVLLHAQVGNVNRVVIPGNYTVTDNYTLPPAGTILVPEHALSLVFFARNGNFNPAATPWTWVDFTQGHAVGDMRTGARRPAYLTLNVNRPAFPAPADRLVPLIVYHAPSAPYPSSRGMAKASTSQPLYQAYDWAAGAGAGAWTNVNNSLLGGDFNVVLDDNFWSYRYFTDAWANDGANCVTLIDNLPVPKDQNTVNQSMVQIVQYMTNNQIYSLNPANFRTRAIDNAFHRGGAGAAAVLYDLPAAVSNAPAPGHIAPFIIQGFRFMPFFNQYWNALLNGLAPPPVPPSINNAVSTMTDLHNGQFGVAPGGGNDTAARRAAEFVRLCISDHLPVCVGLPL